MANRMAKALASRVLSRFLGALLQALAFFVIARQVGATDFGWFAQGMAAGYVGAALAGLGLANRVLTVNGHDDPTGVAGAFLHVRTATIPIGAALAAGGIALLGLPFSMIVMLGAAVAVLDNYVDFLQSALAGLTRDGRAVIVILAQRALPLAVLLAALAVEPGMIIAAFVAGTALSGVVGLVLAAASTTRPATYRVVRERAMGFWFSGIASSLPQLQPAVAGVVLGPAVAGVYAVAVRVTSPLAIVPIGIQTILVPRISTADQARVRAVTKQAYIASALYAVLLAGLALPLGWAVGRALGEGFDHVVSLVAAFTVMSGAAALAQVNYGRLIARHRAGLGATIVIVTTILNLGFLWLIGDLAGAAWLWTVPLIGSVLGVAAFSIADARTAPTDQGATDRG
ncbi:hypothetical protein [Lolliginicoccus suaedae]|uniref:hypothetical protein n=1 Tax=Lolliginicoccus suaedae TaxID=2605429 RepID=UPI0011EFA2A7|nr:hypothetical protein [Lolliginicoccus suaedae]